MPWSPWVLLATSLRVTRRLGLGTSPGSGSTWSNGRWPFGRRGVAGDTVCYFCLGMKSPGTIAVFLEMKIVRGPLAFPEEFASVTENLQLHYTRFRYMPCRYLMADQMPIPQDADLVVFSGVVFRRGYVECDHAPEDRWVSQGNALVYILAFARLSVE